MKEFLKYSALGIFGLGCLWLSNELDKNHQERHEGTNLRPLARNIVTTMCDDYDGLLETNGDIISCLFTSTLEGEEKEGVAKLEQDLAQAGISVEVFSDEGVNGIAQIQRNPNSGWAVITVQ
tara:strand:+ start:1310 stop:1675 length:366 start_codon:yes stop_codon:yes gene_type:complete